jgi:outer membrane protein assembly factor BamB
MTRIKLLVAGIIFLFEIPIISCGQEPKPRYSQKNIGSSSSISFPQLLWKSSISEGRAVGGVMPLFLYNGGIVSNGQGNNSDIQRIVMINTNDGTQRWECQEIRAKRTRLTIYDSLYRYKNILLLRDAPRLYAINLDDGKMLWKKSDPYGYGTSLFDSTFYLGATSGHIWKGNILTGEMDTIFSVQHIIPSPPFSIEICEPSQILPIVQKNKDTLLLISYLLGNRNANIFESWLMLYNTSKKKLMYHHNITDKLVNLVGIYGTMEQYNGNVYITTGRTLACHNIKTGKQVWKKEFLGTLMSAGMIISNGSIFLHSDEYPPQTYAVDPLTGKELWKTPSPGTMLGQLFYMGGVIYSVSGGLHALDAKIGKQLWHFECPGATEKSYDNFFDSVTGIDGKIFVRSGLHLYCYKVAQ